MACGTVRLYWDVKHFEGARTTLTALLEPGGREGGGVIVFSGRHWRKNHSSHIVHEVKHLGAALLVVTPLLCQRLSAKASLAPTLMTVGDTISRFWEFLLAQNIF